jgi:hypothetical protein
MMASSVWISINQWGWLSAVVNYMFLTSLQPTQVKLGKWSVVSLGSVPHELWRSHGERGLSLDVVKGNSA